VIWGRVRVEFLEDGEVSVLLGGFFELRDEVGGGGRIGEAEGHDGVLGIDFDAFDFGELFDA